MKALILKFLYVLAALKACQFFGFITRPFSFPFFACYFNPISIRGRGANYSQLTF